MGSVFGNPNNFQAKYSRIHQQTTLNENVESFQERRDSVSSTNAVRIEKREEIHKSAGMGNLPVIGKTQMDFRIDGNTGGGDAVETTNVNSFQQVDAFSASDSAAEWTGVEEPWSKRRNKFDQKMTMDKVKLLDDIDCSKTPESDREKLDASLKRWDNELETDVFSSDGRRTDVVENSKMEVNSTKNKHSRDLMSILNASKISSGKPSEGLRLTSHGESHDESDEGEMDSRMTSSLEAGNSLTYYPAKSEEMARKRNVRMSEFPLESRGGFNGVRTVSVTRLPDETLGLKLGVHSFIDKGEEKVERVVVNEVTLGGAANRVGQDVCSGDEIVSINNTVFYEQRLENVMDFLKELPLNVAMLVRRGKRSLPPFPPTLDDETLPQAFGTTTTPWKSSNGLSSLMNPVATMFSDDNEELEAQEQNNFDLDSNSSNSYRSRSRPTNVHEDNVDDKTNKVNWHFDSKHPMGLHQEGENAGFSGALANYGINENWLSGRTFTTSSLTDSDMLDKFEAFGDQQHANEIDAKKPLSTDFGLSRTEKSLSSGKSIGLPGRHGKTGFGKDFLGTIEEAASTEEGEQDHTSNPGEGVSQGQISRKFKQPVTRKIDQQISDMSGDKEGAVETLPTKFPNAGTALNLNQENWHKQQHSADLCEFPVSKEFSKTCADKCKGAKLPTDADYPGIGSGSLDDGFEDDDVILDDNTDIRASQSPYDKRTAAQPSGPAGYDKANMSIANKTNELNDRRCSDEKRSILRVKPSLHKYPTEITDTRREYPNGGDKILGISSKQASSVNTDEQDWHAQKYDISVTDDWMENKRQLTSSLDRRREGKLWSYEQRNTGRGSLENITILDTTNSRSNEKVEKNYGIANQEKADDIEKKYSKSDKNTDDDHFTDGGVDTSHDRNRWLFRLPPSCSSEFDQPTLKDPSQTSNSPTIPKHELTNLKSGSTFQEPNPHSSKSVELRNSPVEYKTSGRPISYPLPSSHHQMSVFYRDEPKPNNTKEIPTKDLRKQLSTSSSKPNFQENTKVERPFRSAYEILARFRDDSDDKADKGQVGSLEKRKLGDDDEEDVTSPPPLPATAPPDFPASQGSIFL